MILNKNSIQEFFTSIENSSNICIVGHVAPDGDCIGSVMALYEFISINYNNKNVCVGFDGKIPYNLIKYVNNDIILDDCENQNLDLLIILDCSDKDRLGKYGSLIDKSKKTICIDHHKTNTMFADLNIIDGEICSTGELLYHILKTSDKTINLTMAEYIYIAIITDTGKFAYSSTTAETHMVAAELIKIGIDVSKLDTEIYNSKPLSIVQAYIECVSHINFYHNNKLGIAKISDAIIKKYGIDMNDIEGVVEFIREVNEIEISCVLKEYDIDNTKVSLRAKSYVDVAEIAKKFGGGGHIRASGFQLHMNLKDAELTVVNELSSYLGE